LLRDITGRKEKENMESADHAFGKHPVSGHNVLSDSVMNLLDVPQLQNCVNCEKLAQKLDANLVEFEHVYSKILKLKKTCEKQRKYYLCAMRYLTIKHESDFARDTTVWICPCCTKRVTHALVPLHVKFCFLNF
jgi:hypothetical protein